MGLSKTTDLNGNLITFREMRKEMREIPLIKINARHGLRERNLLVYRDSNRYFSGTYRAIGCSFHCESLSILVPLKAIGISEWSHFCHWFSRCAPGDEFFSDETGTLVICLMRKKKGLGAAIKHAQDHRRNMMSQPTPSKSKSQEIERLLYDRLNRRSKLRNELETVQIEIEELREQAESLNRKEGKKP